jgi:putative hydrolase of HD superfamily
VKGVAVERERLDRQVRFLIEIDSLKQVLRRSYLFTGDRHENSAEHSWHVAVMALVLAEHAEDQLDVGRVMKMLLVHDLVEIDAGDTYCYDDIGNDDKAERERKAADRIFTILPLDQANELRELWEEFEVRESPDARYAAAVDRIMPLLHNYHTQGKSWQEHGVTSDQVIARNIHVREASEVLWRFAQSIIEESVRRGFLKP